MLPITEMFLTNTVANPRRKLLKIKGVVMHWTANTRRGANALANRNFFNKFREGANTSAHYIVDDKVIIQCVKDDEVAYHVGATKYTAIGEKIREGKTPNYFLIGIEMCVNEDADWNKVYQNSVELAAALLKKYKLGINDLYRHYDITGKDCPKMMIDPAPWAKFKADVAAVLGINQPETQRAPEQKPQVKIPTVTLKLGMNNADVKLLQQGLNKLGYKLTVDGDFGKNTETAVKGFQKSKGLEADGIVGPKTWNKIYEV